MVVISGIPPGPEGVSRAPFLRLAWRSHGRETLVLKGCSPKLGIARPLLGVGTIGAATVPAVPGLTTAGLAARPHYRGRVAPGSGQGWAYRGKGSLKPVGIGPGVE
jgi:hypothetical protein